MDPPTFANICAHQQPASFVEVKPGIIDLLRDALASQQGDFQAALSGEPALKLRNTRMHGPAFFPGGASICDFSL